MNPPALAARTDSQLVLVDVQEKLCSAMAPELLAPMLKNCGILLQAAQLLAVPGIYTEQYPQGLGATRQELIPWLTPQTRVEKTCFSCCDSEAFCALLHAARRQVILAGMEAHICVLQSALQLQAQGRQVFVLEDAVLSRNPASHANAMARLRQAGIIVSNTESVLFEWLRVAEGDAFRQISKLIR